jgi:hypothetical protein
MVDAGMTMAVEELPGVGGVKDADGAAMTCVCSVQLVPFQKR